MTGNLPKFAPTMAGADLATGARDTLGLVFARARLRRLGRDRRVAAAEPATPAPSPDLEPTS